MTNTEKISNLADKFPQYIREFCIIHEKEEGILCEILKNVHHEKTEWKFNQEYDNWNGGTHGHHLTIFIPKGLFQKIGKNRKELADKLCELINKLSDDVPNEYISNLAIRLDDTDQETQMSIDDRECSFWEKDHIKMFISHCSQYKTEVSELAEQLKRWGISCFVAHEKIEGGKEWLEELEKGLRSMDMLLAYLTEDFSKSEWTDQEVGFAVARRIPILGLRVEKDPYGFIGRFQAVKATFDDVENTKKINIEKTAIEIVKTIERRKDFSERGLIRKQAITSFINENSFTEIEKKFKRLCIFESFSDEELGLLIDYYNDDKKNPSLGRCYSLVNETYRKWPFLDFLRKHRPENHYSLKEGKIIAEAALLTQ